MSFDTAEACGAVSGSLNSMRATFIMLLANPWRLLGVVAIALCVAGCAGVTFKPVTDDTTATGLRYSDSAPYLFMVKGPNGKWNSQLVYLPDQTRKYQANVWAFLAQNNSSFTYSTNGVLTDTSSTLDTTVIPQAILQAAAAASKFFPAGAPTSLTELLDQNNDTIGLFKIVNVWTGSKWQLGVVGDGGSLK